MSRFWYSYVVPAGDPRLSSSYQRITFNGGKPTCENGTAMCAIYAPEGGPFPYSPLSANLQGYIATALATLTPQPNLPDDGKFFVYLKG